jgi:hypothetical protein
MEKSSNKKVKIEIPSLKLRRLDVYSNRALIVKYLAELLII